MNKNASSSSSSGSRRRRNGRRFRDDHLPQVQGALRGVRRQRWQAGSALSSVAITPAMLCGALSMAIDASNAHTVLSSVRVLAVEMWGPPGTTTPVTVSCEWEGSTNLTADVVYADTSIGSTIPAHVKTNPPEGLVRFWGDAANTTTLFTLNGPSGTVVDVAFEYVTDTSTSSAIKNNFTITGGTAGVSFVRALDGSGGLLVPVAARNYVG